MFLFLETSGTTASEDAQSFHFRAWEIYLYSNHILTL